MKRELLCGALGAMLLTTSAAAQAARPAAAPAAQAAARPAGTPSNPGPVIAGVCVLDSQAAIGNSSAGRAAATRLQQIGQQVNAELQAQQTPLQTEANRINALPEAQRAAPSQALTPRLQTFARLRAQREQELALTQRQALQQIETALQGVIGQLYVQRGCGLMIDRGSVVYSNPAIDVTQAAVTALNARLPTITFNRATLPAASAPAAR